MRPTDALRRALRGLSRAAGYEITRSTASRRARIMAAARIDEVLDVGANVGQFARGLRAHGYRGRIVSFEPLSSAFRALEAARRGDPGWRAVQVAVGDRAGSASLHVAGNSQSSSLLDMLPSHVASAPGTAYVGSEEVRVVPLEAVFREHHAPGARCLLKLDVQGFEQRILDAGEACLAEVTALQLELSLIQLYAGESLLEETLAFLRGRGFIPAMLERTFTDQASGHTLQVDGVFVRSPAP